MTNKVVEDFNRRSLDFWNPKVVEVLPEHFRSEYPKLIQLLDAYYDFMDSDGNVDDDLRQLLRVRDVDGVSLDLLDYLLDETGAGISQSQLVAPREAARFLPDFFRYKGSNFSTKAFFRSIYGEEPEVTYPKDNLFIVGESRIGYNSLKFIQDGALYQVLSVLVKSSRSRSNWIDLYKRYVHPAGFYLGNEVIAEEIVNLNLGIMPDAIPDMRSGEIQIISSGSLFMSAPTENLTALFISPDSDIPYRIDLDKSMIVLVNEIAENIDSQYAGVADFATASTIGLSDSHAPNEPKITWASDNEVLSRSPYDSSGSNVWSS